MALSFKLLEHQEEFVFDTAHRFVGFKGGYGAGKTLSLCYKAIVCAKRNPGKLGALLEPIMAMVITDLAPTWERTLDEAMGDKNWTRTSKTHYTYELRFPGQRPSTVMLLSAENHIRLRGKNFAWWGIDEFDTIQPLSLQNAVLEQLIARLRTGETDSQEQGFFVSTPEGFAGLYHFFVEEPERLKKENKEWVPDRHLYTASTRANYLLKPSYIKSMSEKYPAHLLAAYVDGEFVNMTRGSVYPDFDKDESATTLTWDSPELDGAVINVGIDFNVLNMSVIAAVIKNDVIYVVDEIIGDRNTRAAIESIKERDWYLAGREIYVHPDKSGIANDSTSDKSDVVLLQEAFGEQAVILEDADGRRSNPAVQDRVNSVNGRIKNGRGRNLFVNPDTCPVTASAFMKQPYNDKGVPLKDGKMDGPLDAVGYICWSFYPIRHHHWSQGGSIA